MTPTDQDPTNEPAADQTDLEAEIARLQEQLLRSQADFINYKDRAARERAEFAAFAQEGMVSNFLPVLDAVDQAMNHIPDDIADHDWTKGIQTIAHMLTSTLTTLGVAKMPIEEGTTPFDPAQHEAIGQETAEGKSGLILKVWQHGYTLKGSKVLRPAKVTVGE